MGNNVFRWTGCLFSCFLLLAVSWGWSEPSSFAGDSRTVAGPDQVAVESPAESSSSVSPRVDWRQLKILELDQQGINWRQDWWKYLLMLLAVLLCLCLIIYLTRVLFWLFGVIVCLGSGIAGGFFLAGLFTSWLPPLLPEAVTALVSAPVVCHILGGILGYGVAACCLGILVRPLKAKKRHD